MIKLVCYAINGFNVNIILLSLNQVSILRPQNELDPYGIHGKMLCTLVVYVHTTCSSYMLFRYDGNANLPAVCSNQMPTQKSSLGIDRSRISWLSPLKMAAHPSNPEFEDRPQTRPQDPHWASKANGRTEVCRPEIHCKPQRKSRLSRPIFSCWARNSFYFENISCGGSKEVSWCFSGCQQASQTEQNVFERRMGKSRRKRNRK